MLNEDLITDSLADVGYRRIKQRVYKACWSTPDIDHFLYICLWGTPKEFLSADFGVRNEGAEAFSIKSLVAYGSDLYRLLRHDAHTDCSMRFSLGKLGAWGSRWSLYLPEMSMAALSEKIKADVQERLIPVIRGVTSLDRLLSLLLDDAEPCPWVRINGAIRAAQIAYVARRLDKGPAEIRAMLKPHERQIVANLGRGAEDSALYIERIIENSARME